MGLFKNSKKVADVESEDLLKTRELTDDELDNVSGGRDIYRSPEFSKIFVEQKEKSKSERIFTR